MPKAAYIPKSCSHTLGHVGSPFSGHVEAFQRNDNALHSQIRPLTGLPSWRGALFPIPVVYEASGIIASLVAVMSDEVSNAVLCSVPCPLCI